MFTKLATQTSCSDGSVAWRVRSKDLGARECTADGSHDLLKSTTSSGAVLSML